jgi:hypothetical protein
VYEKPVKMDKPWLIENDYQSIEDKIFRNPRNLSIEKDRIMMKFNIKPKE